MGISMNPNITIQFIEKYIETGIGFLYLIIQISLWNLLKSIQKPWDWWSISENPNITMEIIEKHPKKPWHWFLYLEIQISLWNLLKSLSEKPWRWDGISENPNITMEFIEKYIDKINFQELIKINSLLKI